MRFAHTLIVFLALASAGNAAVFTGRVSEVEGGQPLGAATIRIEDTDRSVLTNDDGYYRMRLDPGVYHLKFSHVGHYSEVRELQVGGEDQVLDIALKRAYIEVSSMRVYEEAYDPAQKIILQAIENKQAILSRINEYDFDAYTKLLVTDPTKEDTADNVVILTETQLTAYWEYPQRYKEVIKARKQTANLDAEGNLVTLGEVLNFNENRLGFGPNSVVSPTATDALDYYNFYLLDSLYRDDQLVYHIEVEPKNPTDQLFVGTIDIADNSFAVAGVDVVFSEGAQLRFFKDLRYTQTCSEFDDSLWMPVLIGITGGISLPIPGLGPWDFDYQAAIHEYRFRPDHQPGLFDYVLEVDARADDVDSVKWYAQPLIPLTDVERRGYEYHDSLANAPKPLLKRSLNVFGWLVGNTIFNYDFFHFNRVEGAYLGYGYTYRPRFGTTLEGRAGWSFEAERFQHEVSWRQRLWKRRRLDLEIGHHHVIKGRPLMVTSSTYNSTFWALMSKSDPVDYFREEGFRLGLSGELVKHVRLGVGYADYQHYSEPARTDYSFFLDEKIQRHNPAIDDGHLRSLSAALVLDTRGMMKLKHSEERTFDLPSTLMSVRVEHSSPDLIESDFDFTRYSLWMWRAQRTLGLGVTWMEFYLGASDRQLPVQRLFTVDFGDEVFGNALNFKTLREHGFSGDRAAMGYVLHDFGRRVWQKSGVPLVRDIPFSLSLYGGAFVTDYDNPLNQPAEPALRTDDYTMLGPAQKMFSEIGFELGDLPPFAMSLYFTWQLSDYEHTSRFSIHWGWVF